MGKILLCIEITFHHTTFPFRFVNSLTLFVKNKNRIEVDLI